MLVQGVINMTTLTIRTDEELKKSASKLFESLGMNLSSAINMFLKQAVIQRKFPCSIEAEVAKDYSNTYPEGFFNLFGLIKDEDMDIPEDTPITKEEFDL